VSGGVAATGPAGAIGPATRGGAVGASGAGACATGGGESNACAWTGALTPEEAAVGGTSGSAGDNGAGGTVPAAADNGSPACRLLSKLCINSPGVRPWAEPVGASGALAKGDMPVEGSGPAPTVEGTVVGIEAPGPPSAGTGGDVAAGGTGVGAGGMPPAWVKLIGEPVRGVGCRDGGRAAGTMAVLVKASEPGGA
jgi:hypothetical protein